MQPIFSAAARAWMSGTHGRTALPRGLLRLMAGTCLLLTLCSCAGASAFMNSLPTPSPAPEGATQRAAWGLGRTDAIPPPEVQAYELARIDFRIITGHARILKRDYVLASAPDPRPEIIALGNHVYFLKMVFDHHSRRSEELSVHFYYDGTELIFFWDINENYQFDHRDTRVARYLIESKRGPPREVEFEAHYSRNVKLLIVFDRRY